MRRASWILLGCVFVSAGCDRGWNLQGRVRTRAPSSEEALPVDGATVQVGCNDDVPLQAQSNAKGVVNLSRLGPIADDCTVEVSAPGLESQTFTVAELCTHRYGPDEVCGTLELDAVLAPPPVGE